MNEMEKMSKEVAALEQALQNKTNSVKLAETRLENRMFRLGSELVQDEAQTGLTDELLHLRQTCQDLNKELDDGKLVLVLWRFLFLAYLFSVTSYSYIFQECDHQLHCS